MFSIYNDQTNSRILIADHEGNIEEKPYNSGFASSPEISTSKNPLVPPPLHAIYCDCMVNKVRSRYSQRHLALINNDKELNVIMVDIAQECVDEVIDPIYPQKNKPEAEKTSTYG